MGIFQNGLISQVLLTESPSADIVDLNTLFYAVVALGVLFLIMLITYFTTIKPNLKGNAEQVKNSVNHVITQSDMDEQQELVDDYELVAVITAAINASMGEDVPANGFVVRSIRRVNSRKWMNA